MKLGYFMILLSLALAGCGEPRPAAESGSAKPEEVAGPETVDVEESEIRAWVNGAPVYDAEIDFFLETRMNLLPFERRNEELREKVLKSLVMSRAMAQAAERDLRDRDRRRLALETDFFREEQLAKRYLEEHAQPKPVSREQVREYYERHPEEFGRRTLREIEWLATVEGLDEAEREALLSTFQSLDGVTDWQALAERTNAGAARVEYQRGSFASDLLDPRLDAVVAATAIDGVSGLQMIDGRLHRVRVLGETVQAPQPLDAVTVEIRKRLAPVAMRESVGRASEAVMAGVEVRYPEAVKTE